MADEPFTTAASEAELEQEYRRLYGDPEWWHDYE